MYLPDFNAYTPKSLKEAAELLAQYGAGEAMVLAGGTDLLVRMKEGTAKPRIVIILEKIKR